MDTNILRAKTIDLFGQPNTEKQKVNSALNKKEALEGKAIIESFPRRLVLELTNACNLHCIMCGREQMNFTPNFFDINYLKQIEPILHYTEEVTLFGWGEPTIHPKFKEIISLLDKYPVRKYFVTNGTTLSKIQDILFDFKVDIMAVSLDGATETTNNKIRRGSNFAKIISSLKDITEIKKKNEFNYPYINFVTTLMKSNLHELPDMINLAADIGIEEIKVVYLTSFNKELEDEVLLGSVDEIKKVFEETIKRGKLFGIKVKLPYIPGEDIAGEKLHKDCFVGWRDFFIGSDGYVRPCQSNAKRFFHVSKYTEFKESWNAPEIVEFRQTVNDENKMSDECKRCYQSSFANWNKKTSFLQIDQKFAPEWERSTTFILAPGLKE